MSSFDYYGISASHASTYAEFRKPPPEELIAAIVEFTKEELSLPLGTAVDVGCGSGQSTYPLHSFFEQVVGLDPSQSIVDEALKSNEASNVTYRVSGAEFLPFADDSVDLITVCQAAHWFDLPKFYKEAERVLKKNGVLVIYGYSLPELFVGDERNTNNLVRRYYEEVLGTYILPQSPKVYIKRYTDPEFNDVPFVQNGKMLRKDGFKSVSDTTLPEIIGYIKSWSGFQNYIKSVGEDAAEKVLIDFQKEFESNLIGDYAKLKASREYFALMGRKQ